MHHLKSSPITDALGGIRERLPFPLQGIDCDNDALFINAHLLKYCQDEKLTFTRSRTYKKNNNPYVGQKNRSIIRKCLGYCRYDRHERLEIINKINAKISLYNNYFQPFMKLKEKIRYRSKVKRIYDEPRTLFAWVLERKEISEDQKQKLKSIYASLNPKNCLRKSMISSNYCLRLWLENNMRQW